MLQSTFWFYVAIFTSSASVIAISIWMDLILWIFVLWNEKFLGPLWLHNIQVFILQLWYTLYQYKSPFSVKINWMCLIFILISTHSAWIILNLTHHTLQIADSFPGMETFAPAMAPQPHVQTTVDLRKPPKWLRRPAGVSFAVSLLHKFINIKM